MPCLNLINQDLRHLLRKNILSSVEVLAIFWRVLSMYKSSFSWWVIVKSLQGEFLSASVLLELGLHGNVLGGNLSCDSFCISLPSSIESTRQLVTDVLFARNRGWEIKLSDENTQLDSVGQKTPIFAWRFSNLTIWREFIQWSNWRLSQQFCRHHRGDWLFCSGWNQVHGIAKTVLLFSDKLVLEMSQIN